MDRRGFIVGAAAAALVPAAAKGGGPTLRAVASSRGLDVGTAVGETASVRVLHLVNAHCTLITPEWQLKPRFLKPTATAAYTFRPADEIARLAEVNGQKLHGHSLFWHRQSIPWAERGGLEEVKRIYGGFIGDVVSRYPGIVSWDVFNEIVDHPGAAKGATAVDRFGPDFVDFCFRAAHRAAPGAKLALNEHSLECAGEWCGHKQQNALRMLEALIKRGVPVHALGMQAHLSSVWIPWATQAARFARRVGELGLDVYLSEVDVDDSQLARDPTTRDRQVAAYYRDFLGPMLDERAVKRVVFWGLSDSDHWMARRAGRGAPARPRPALFDENDDPKPAFDAVLTALSQAPKRQPG